jgi:hypothetical protein
MIFIELSPFASSSQHVPNLGPQQHGEALSAWRYGADRYSNQSKSAGDVAGRPRPVA